MLENQRIEKIRLAAVSILFAVALACVIMVAQIGSPYSPWVLDKTTGAATLAAQATLCISQNIAECSGALYPPGVMVAYVPIVTANNFLIYTTSEGYLAIARFNDASVVTWAQSATDLIQAATPQAFFSQDGGVVVGQTPFFMQPGVTVVMGNVNATPPIKSSTWKESSGGFAFADPASGAMSYMDRVCTAPPLPVPVSADASASASVQPTKCGYLFRAAETGIGTVFVTENQIVLGDAPPGFVEASSNDFVLVGGNTTILSYQNLGTATYCISTDISSLKPQGQRSNALLFTVYTGGRTCSYTPSDTTNTAEKTTSVPQSVTHLQGLSDAFDSSVSFVVDGATTSLFSTGDCSGTRTATLDSSLGCPSGRTYGIVTSF